MPNKFSNKKINIRYIYYMKKRNNSLMTNCLRQSTRTPFLLTLLCALFLSGCNMLNVQSENTDDDLTVGFDSEPEYESDTKSVAQPENPLSLDGDLLFHMLAGEFAGNAGDLDKAVYHYQQATSYSNDARIAARSTYVALYGEDYEQALDAVNRWNQLDPDEIDVLRIYAVIYLKLQQPLKAVPYIKKMLALSKNAPKHDALLIKKLLSKEAAVKDGLVVLQSLVAAAPDNLHMLILEARYFAQLQRYEEAITALDKVLAIDAGMSNVHIIKSRILTVMGKKEEAMESVLNVLREQPQDYELRLSYARMLIERRMYEEAREQFLMLKEQKPDGTEVLLSLSLLYIDTKQLDEAAVHLERLLELDQKLDVAHYYLGRIAHNKKQYKTAISHYIKVQSADYSFEAKLRIAGLFALLGKSEEAIEQLDLLASQQTSWAKRVRVYLATGEVLRGLKRYEEALEMYNRVLQQKPNDSDLLYARAMVAEKVDRLDITEADLLKVLATEPENVHALNALGYTLADRTERLEEAYGYIKQAAVLVPDDPAILDSLGWVSYRLGRLQDAIKWMGMAYDKLIDAEIAAHYGEVLWKNNQREKAQQVWQSGLEQNAKHPVLIETIKRLKPEK